MIVIGYYWRLAQFCSKFVGTQHFNLTLCRWGRDLGVWCNTLEYLYIVPLPKNRSARVFLLRQRDMLVEYFLSVEWLSGMTGCFGYTSGFVLVQRLFCWLVDFWVLWFSHKTSILPKHKDTLQLMYDVKGVGSLSLSFHEKISEPEMHCIAAREGWDSRVFKTSQDILICSCYSTKSNDSYTR